MGEFTMPSLGADMTEGTLLEWLVRPGDRVRRGDLVAVVDTDKAAIDIEVFSDGVVDRLLVEPGTRVPVGTALAVLTSEPAAPEPAAPAPILAPRVTPPVRRLARDLGVDLATVPGSGPDGAVTRADVEAAAGPPQPAPPQPAPPQPAPPRRHRPRRARPEAAGAPATRLRISPYARRRATELGVDPTSIAGSGRAGAIIADDVTRAARAGAPPTAPAATAAKAATATTAPPPPPPAGGAERSAAMRRAIAALMARSKREIPHYYLSTTVDLSPAQAWLAATNAGRAIGERLVPAVLMLRATALAARKVPQLNGFWMEDAFRPGDGVQLGVAISLRAGGMIAPAIRDADTLAPAALMTALRDLVSRARDGRLRGSEMSGGTLTVTNLGDRGVESVFGVIYPPQVALVGFGTVVERPWASQGMLGVRPVVTVTLAADHRATDGHLGGRFLTEIDRLLTHPEEL